MGKSIIESIDKLSLGAKNFHYPVLIFHGD